MSVVNSIETVGPWRKRLEIEIPAPDVASETDEVVKEYGRHVRIPGFRKGKIPAALVRQRYKSEIESEVVDRLVPRFWRTAQEESEIDPILPPSLGTVDFKEGEPIVFEATVEVRPEIEIGDLDGFELPEEDTAPTDDEVAQALAKLQTQVAEWVDADRPVERGDLVTLELDELDDEGESIDGDKDKEVKLEVGDERVWEELTLAVTGLTVGQETDFKRQESTDDEERVRSFHAKVISIQERDLPPLDDELAKKVGTFESIDDLREQVTKQLGHEKYHDLRSRREQAVRDQLRDRHPLELPEGLVGEESRTLLNDYAQNLARQGVDIDKAQIDWEALAKEVKPQAERRVHVRLLLDAVSERESIEVEPSEVEGRVALLAKAQGQSVPVLRRTLESDGRLEGLAAQMRREKTIAHLLGDEDHDHDHGDAETDDDAAREDSGATTAAEVDSEIAVDGD